MREARRVGKPRAPLSLGRRCIESTALTVIRAGQ
jgi:hypothetical protein